MDLSDQTVLVTGANRGIGRALAEEVVKRPRARVLAGARSPEKVKDSGELVPVRMDLSSRETIDESWAALDEEVDVLVNNAGLMTGGLLEEQDLGEVYDMFQVNLAGLVHLTALALPGMLERGRGWIVNNASISGYAYFPAATTYAAGKAGVVAFSESLRRELKGTGVGVTHTVTPGVKTDMLDATKEAYGEHLDTSSWTEVTPEEWARKVVSAVEDDDHIVGPGGRIALAKLASRGPAAVLDAITGSGFSRAKRGSSR
jgi:short-subunit dehydrogenase